MAEERERYRLKASSNSATISGSILLNNKLTTGARVCAGAILLHQQNGDPPPTRDELAADLDVDTRTVDRWLDELRDAHLIESMRDGRRNVYSFLKPRKTRKFDKKISLSRSTASRSRSRTKDDKKIADPRISLSRSTASRSRSRTKDNAKDDKKIADPRISDPRIADPRISLSRSTASRRRSRAKDDKFVALSPVGVGVGDHDSEVEEPTPTPREPLKTELGRYMARKRYMAAPRFDREDLDCAAHVVAIEQMEHEGLSKSQIVYFLELDPPTRANYPPPSADETPAPIAEELPALADEQPGELADEQPDEQPGELADEDRRLDLGALWDRVLNTMQIQTTRQEFNTWLRPTSLLSVEDGVALVATTSVEQKGGFEDRYIGPVRDLICHLVGFPVRVRVVIAVRPS